MNILKPLLIIVLTCTIIGLLFWFSKSKQNGFQFETQSFSTSSASVKITLPECDGIIASSTEVSIKLPIKCKEDIGNGEEPVEVSIFASSTNDNQGEMHISRNGKDIFVINDSDANPASLSNNYDPTEGPTLNSLAFDFTDVTFDGYKDLMVLTSQGAYNMFDSYYRYNPKTKMFDLEPILDVVNEDVDLKNKTVESFEKIRGLGDLYTDVTYKYINGEYIEIKSVTQDSENPDEENAIYTITTEELINGKMVQTKKETKTHKEIYGDE